jgi:hypothetical protein
MGFYKKSKRVGLFFVKIFRISLRVLKLKNGFEELFTKHFESVAPSEKIFINKEPPRKFFPGEFLAFFLENVEKIFL